MISGINITAKTEINGETLIRLAEIQAEIQKNNTETLAGLANNGIQFLVLVQQARIAEAQARSADSAARVAEAEAQKAAYEAEKAKYAAEAATADAEFRKSVKSAKKPYTNGVAAYNGE